MVFQQLLSHYDKVPFWSHPPPPDSHTVYAAVYSLYILSFIANVAHLIKSQHYEQLIRIDVAGAFLFPSSRAHYQRYNFCHYYYYCQDFYCFTHSQTHSIEGNEADRPTNDTIQRMPYVLDPIRYSSFTLQTQLNATQLTTDLIRKVIAKFTTNHANCSALLL